VPLIHRQAKGRRHRCGNYPTMTANKDGGTPMTISYFTKSFGNPMTKTRTAVSPGNNGRIRVPLFEISQIVSSSDFFPGKTVSFSQPEFFQIGMNVYFEI
jgi:hypothetical protein